MHSERVLLEKQPMLVEKTGFEYRYGFQGQESDDEVKGAGNSVNYKYRMHDPRVGRFFAVDPLASEFPWNSPYVFSENNVINSIELEGAESLKATDGSINPAFKVKAIITLPNASTVNVYNRVKGGGHVISAQDASTINSFNAQGFFKQNQIEQNPTTNITRGTNTVVIPLFVDGVTMGSNKYKSSTITVPDMVIPQIPLSQNMGGIENLNTETRVPSPITSEGYNATNTGNAAGANANSIIAGMRAAMPVGSTLNDIAVNVSYNQNMSSSDFAAFQTAVSATVLGINPSATMNFTSFNPSTDSAASGRLIPNAVSVSPTNSNVTATQTNPPVPTVMEVSAP